MEIPLYLTAFFFLTAALAIFLFYKAVRPPFWMSVILFVWIIAQTILITQTSFYKSPSAMPPRFLAMVLPPMLLIIAMLLSVRGRRFMRSLNLAAITRVHIIRIPVEIALFGLFLAKAVPVVMTFEGGNLDILSGLSAIIVYYAGFRKKLLSNKIMLIWNVICVGLLTNIVVHALLSVPSPIQRFGITQPNIAFGYFPFMLLPAVVVPIVLFCHVVAFIQLTGTGRSTHA